MTKSHIIMFEHLGLQNAMLPLLMCQYHIILMLAPMEHMNAKVMLQPYFSCLDLTNSMMSFTMLVMMTSCDQQSYHTLCQLSPCSKQNSVIDDAIDPT